MLRLSWGGKFWKFWSLFICFYLAEQALGQVTGGSISGRVSDTSGAAIPAATVTINNTETGASRAVNTDEAGNYRELSLSVGRYEVRAEKPGFKTAVRRGISLAVAQEAVVDLEMQVGEVTQQVTVTAEIPVVNTTTSQLSALVGEQQVKDLPLNGRSFDNLIALNPGAINYTALKGQAAAGGGGNYFTVAGRRPLENLFLLNGIEYTGSNSIGITPGGVSGQLLGIEAVREFNVLTDAYSAEYGKRAGAHVSVVTQSGTNELRGSVFEFVRNDKFDARNFFDPGAIPAFRRNQFGGSLGGPVKKDKAFLFGSYEGERQRLGITDVAFVPDDNARRGFLPSGPNNSLMRVPNLDTRMLPFMALWPEPNGPDLGSGIATFSANPKQSIREDFATVRFDQNVSQKDNVSISDTFDDGGALTPFTDPLFAVRVVSRAQVFSVQETHTFSSRVFNTVRAGFSRSRFAQAAPPLEPVPPNLELIQGQEPGAIVIGGGTAAQAFASALVPAGVTSLQANTFNVRNLFTGQDDAQIIRARHQFSFGGWAQRVQVNANSRDYQLGQATFTSLTTFLAGRANLFTGAPYATVMYWRQWEGAWYAQDNLQLRPNLTVRIGLRHEFTDGWNEADGRAAQFIPDANGVLQNPRVGKSAFTVNNATKLFSPRVGIAWDPFGKGKTSIRSAFGIYYTLLDDLSFHLGVVPPFNSSFSFQNVSLPDFIPVSNTAPLPPGCGLRVPLPCTTYAPRGVDAAAKTPTALEWNYSIEQALSQNMSLRIGYVGSHSYHNLINVDPNSIAPQICANAAGCLAGGVLPAAQAALVLPGAQYIPLGQRPNPFLSNGFFWYAEGVSNYHALEVDLTKRFSSGLAFRASYTFSKNLDEGSGLSANEAQNQTQGTMDPRDPLRDYGRSALDFEHQGSGNFSYQLPFGHGRRFLNRLGGVPDRLVGGWQMNGIVTLLSGFPITPLVGTNQSGDGDLRNPDRPNVNPNFQGNLLPHTVNEWFNPAAYSLPAAGTWGNAGRGVIDGPGLADFDFSMFKITPVKESASLEFRAEFFNITNAVNFGVPNTALFSAGKISPSAGRITSTTTNSRQIQLGLKFIF